MTEPWISGSYAEVDPLVRPLLHCFDHALLDLEKWTEGLTSEQIWARPMGLGAVGFHMKHITGSADRLITYADGQMLSEEQMRALRAEETETGGSREELLGEMRRVFAAIAQKVRAMDTGTLREARGVGRKQLPTTVHGLLVHMAEHTMRHVGEAIITAKVVKATT